VVTQPTREHRHDIHPRLFLSYGIVSDILWRQALDARQPVGVCSRPVGTGHCGGLMRGLEPEQRGPRWFYPARCSACGREVEGQGPRPAKASKGAER
jgi:hypothetical protein